MPLYNALQLDKIAVKEMASARKNDHRQRLWPCPFEYFFQRHDLVLLSMDYQRVDRDTSERKAPDSRGGQHQVCRRQALHDRRGDERPKRKSADGKFAFSKGAPSIIGERQKIVDFAASIIEYTATRADSAEVEPQRTVTQRYKRFGQGLDNLVVQRASIQRMRMGQQR